MEALLSEEEREVLLAEQKKSDETLRHNELNDLRWLIEHKAGRNILVRLIRQSGLFSPSTTPGMPDLTMFNDGKKDSTLWFMAELREAVKGREDDAKNFDKLMREYWSE